MTRQHGAHLILLLATAATAQGCAYLNGNFRAVEEGWLYRSGQLNPAALERRIEEHSIREVVSLRDPKPKQSWYRDETRVCEELGVDHYDIPWSMRRLPDPQSLERLIGVFAGASVPRLIHCHGGVHRSAVASAVYLLVRGASVEQARGQIGPHFNDAPVGQLLDLYEDSGKPFAAWVVEDYPGLYAAHPDGGRVGSLQNPEDVHSHGGPWERVRGGGYPSIRLRRARTSPAETC